MEAVILEISLCLIENTIIYTFLNSLLNQKFVSSFPLVVTILMNSLANFQCSEFNMYFKIPLALFCLLIGVSVLFKDKLFVKLTYLLISLYSIYIVDIILGNIISLIFGKNISQIFFANFAYRLLSCFFIKVTDGFVFMILYKMLSKIDKKIRNKFWILFSVVVFVFIAITMVFLQIYPETEQNSASTIMYTVLTSLFFVMSIIVIYFYTELSKGFQRDSKLFLLENNFSTLQEQIAVQQQSSENVRKLRHDMKNHLANIRLLIDNGEISDAVTLLDKTAENVNNTKAEMLNTGNSFVDAILLSKTAVCREKNIDFTYSVQPLAEINIDVVDLSSLLSNLLDKLLFGGH